jgi:hypothetical protein
MPWVLCETPFLFSIVAESLLSDAHFLFDVDGCWTQRNAAILCEIGLRERQHVHSNRVNPGRPREGSLHQICDGCGVFHRVWRNVIGFQTIEPSNEKMF